MGGASGIPSHFTRKAVCSGAHQRLWRNGPRETQDGSHDDETLRHLAWTARLDFGSLRNPHSRGISAMIEPR